MDIDTEKIDEAVLALLYLTLHDGPAHASGKIQKVLMVPNGFPKTQACLKIIMLVL